MATSILAGVTTKAPQAGVRIVIAAQEKIGKTTLGCGAPNILLIPLEQGSGAMNVPRVPMERLTTWEDVIQLCDELIAGAQAGRIRRGSSLLWDSATALERVIHDYVLRTDKFWKAGNPNGVTLESAHGGYGKAYSIANDQFERWTRYMDALAFHGGINIITTCHVFAAKVVDPASGEYDTWDLQLHSPKNQKTYGKREFITQWADLIGFLHEPMFVMKASDGERMNRGISSNQGRMLALDRTPSWVAGNRYGLTGLIPIPKDGGWNVLARAIWDSTDGAVDIFNREGT